MIRVLNKNKDDCSCGVYIGRGSPLGNPFDWTGSKHEQVKYQVPDRDTAIKYYEEYLREGIKNKDKEICGALNNLWKTLKSAGELNLICFCKPLNCHGDVIERILEEKLDKAK